MFGVGMKSYLETMNGLGSVEVKWVKTGWNAIDEYREWKPDLVILDIELPDMSGHEVMEILQREDPQSRIIIVTSHSNSFTMWRMRHMGVVGILDKNEADMDELKHAINESVEGRIHRSKNMDRLCRGIQTSKIPFYKIMTPREQKLMKYFGMGYTNSMIADLLELKESTIQGHRRNVMNKLGVSSTPDLMCYALASGFVNTSEIVRERLPGILSEG